MGRALELLQERVALEPCRRAAMRALGARPRAGLFGDPLQGSAAASRALQGVLPAQATGNELRSAAFVGGLVKQLRPLLGTWSALVAERPRGWRDLVPCLRSFREICLGTESHWVGHMMATGLTTRVAASGGQEHARCGCGEWLTRQKLKAHHCEHVGKPHLHSFRQSRGILGFQIAYRHLQKQVEITLEAALEPSKLLAMDIWHAQVACSWRLCPRPLESPPTACKSPFISSDELLGWMQSQERERTYTSRQVIREDLCEARGLGHVKSTRIIINWYIEHQSMREPCGTARFISFGGLATPRSPPVSHANRSIRVPFRPDGAVLGAGHRARPTAARWPHLGPETSPAGSAALRPGNAHACGARRLKGSL